MEAVERLRTSTQLQRVKVRARERIGPRIILSCMVYLAFVISGMIENSVSVALLRERRTPAAIRVEVGANASHVRRYCDPPNMTALAIYYDSSEELDEDTDYDFSQLQEMDFQLTLSSRENMESVLKKAFLWGHLVSPLPASRLAANIGPKRVFGYGMLGAGAATLLVPAAWLSPAHMVIRFSQGLFYGAMLPSVHMLAVNWFPPNRRTSLLTLYSGVYVGYALSEMFTLKCMDTVGHDSVFYIMALLVIAWFVLWSLLVFNSPGKHPRLSKEQRKRMEDRTGVNLSSGPLGLPWRRVLCSRPVWMSVAATFGTFVGQSTLNIALLQYLNFVYGITDSTLTVVPFILHSLFALLCGYLVDYIRQIKLVSTTSARRIFVYISHFIVASLLFVVGFVGCNRAAPAALYSLAVIASGASYAGVYASCLDIAPNFAGSVFGLCCTFGAAGSLVTSYTVSQILNGTVPGSWRMSFSLCSVTLLVTSIFFMLRGSGREQPWNSPELSEQQMRLCSQPGSSRAASDSPGDLLRAKHKLNVEEKILKVLLVQEPERFTRVRAYSTSSPERVRGKLGEGADKKRASIS